MRELGPQFYFRQNSVEGLSTNGHRPFRVTQAERLGNGLAKVVVHMPDFSVRFGEAGGETELDAYRNAFVVALGEVYPEVAEVKVSQDRTNPLHTQTTVVFERGDQKWEAASVRETETNPARDFRVTRLGSAVAQGFMDVVKK